jgi:hypothetical protein
MVPERGPRSHVPLDASVCLVFLFLFLFYFGDTHEAIGDTSWEARAEGYSGRKRVIFGRDERASLCWCCATCMLD